MEFQNQVLRIGGEVAAYTETLLTPGAGAERARRTLFEELDELIDEPLPPRWLLLSDDLLVHLAEPMFSARGYDADEYIDDAEDEFVYLDASGDTYLRDGDKEYDIDHPDVAEIAAFVCASGDLLGDFVWFGDVPELVIFQMMMDDAADAYRGALPAYQRQA